MGNYKDSKIEVLAKKGNGNFAYLDDIREAEKVLVTEFTQTLYSIANNVYMSVKFDSNVVKEYRLIGYDNKRNALAEKGDELEGGEIGAATGNTAVFEIVPAKKDSLKPSQGPLGHISLHFRATGDIVARQVQYESPKNYVPFDSLCPDLRFASAVTMMGMKLRGSPFMPDIEWEAIKNVAVASLRRGDYLQTEFIGLIDKCKTIYYEKKKKKRK